MALTIDRHASEHGSKAWLVQTYDFARLYTNIPLPDLTSRVTGLIQTIFSRHGGEEAVRVYARQHPPVLEKPTEKANFTLFVASHQGTVHGMDRGQARANCARGYAGHNLAWTSVLLF